MIELSLSTIATHLDAQLHGDDIHVSRVSTDSRTLQPGDLFVALRGPHFDAHLFGPQAVDAGARAFIVEKILDVHIPQILVKDTRKALGQLGALVRQHCPAQIVAITGSCGKTTVKEMLTAILGHHGHTLATQGNFNNEIGVPLTLLRLTPEHHYGVLELGANHAGEIAWTTSLVKPDVALINNVVASHLEGFGSLDEIAKAKGEIFQGVPADGFTLANADDHYWTHWKQLYPQLIGFGRQNPCAQVFARNVNMHGPYATFELHTPAGQISMTLTLPGEHQVRNALAAATAASMLNIPLSSIKKGLESTYNLPGRCKIHPLKQLTLIDDSYNASLDSVLRALDLLATYPGHQIFVFGGMVELGEQTRAAHITVAQYAQQLGIDSILTFGEASKETAIHTHNGKHCIDYPTLIRTLQQDIEQHVGCTVLVKGARSARMERVVQDIYQNKRAAIC